MQRKERNGAGAPQLLPLAAMMMAVGLPAAAQTQSKQDPAITLAPVVVKGEAEGSSQGYLGTKTRVGKVLQDPHDVAQAVTSVTNLMLEEQQVGSLKEALRNVSGLSFNAAEGGRSGDNFNLRGFYTFGDMYLDGIRDTAQYNRETFNLEQVDVLRGAGAMLFGRGQAGGVINLVSKTPLPFDKYKLTASVGTDNYREVTADLNKFINQGTQLRVNLMKRDEGSWRSNPSDGAEPELHRKGAAFSLALNQDSNNRFWLNHYNVDTDDNPDYGVSFNNTTRKINKNFPAKYFWGNKNTFDVSDTNITTLVNEYQFARPETMLRTQLRVAQYDRSYWARTPSATVAPNPTGLMGGGYGPTRTSNYETITLQSDFSTKFNVAGMRHEFLSGVEYLNENGRRRGLYSNAGLGIQPRPYVEDSANENGLNRFKSDSWAAYVQDTVEFIPKWKATLGLRRDHMNADYRAVSNTGVTTTRNVVFSENSTRTSLSYHPDEGTHYYVAYSDSFSPTADLYQLTGAVAYPAERSQVGEVGAKWLLLDGDLAFRTALYRANKDWERNADLESTASILSKQRRTDGIEFELAGKLTDRWEIFSGLALMDSKILKGGFTNTNVQVVGLNGKESRNTPKATFNLWTTYRLDGNWKVGGGVEAKSSRVAYSPTSLTSAFVAGKFNPNSVPGYARWDAMVAYEQAKWAVRLNIKNVFNKLYWDSLYDNGSFAVPGTKRAAILSAELKF